MVGNTANSSAWCCESAGIFNIIQPEMSQQLLSRKLDHIARTGATIVAMPTQAATSKSRMAQKPGDRSSR